MPISHDPHPGSATPQLRRLVLDELIGSGRPWPSRLQIDEAAALAGSLADAVLDAIASGAVRCRAGTFTFDRSEPATWYRLVRVDADGGVRICTRRALQIAEYVRLRRSIADPGAIRAVDAGIDLAVDLPGGRRWAIGVMDAPLDDLREHVREVRFEGVAIVDLAVSEGLRPAARTAAVLHDGGFDHYSLIGRGVRFDLRVHRRDGCVLLERDVPPR